MKKVFLIQLISYWCFLGCTTSKEKHIILSNNISVVIAKNEKLNDKEFEGWQYKDIFEDTVPGVSLEKVYREFLKDKKGVPIIVAVIDTEVDIHHEDLKEQIWVNANEIPENGIDDDHNGYIDDIHGWNFIGNVNGENIIHSNYGFIRLIRKFKPLFQNKTVDSITFNQIKDFEAYQKALKSFGETQKSKLQQLENVKGFINKYNKAQHALKAHLSVDSITKEQLLALHSTDTIIKKYQKTLINYINRGFTEHTLLGYLEQTQESIDKSLDFDYQEREIIGDDLNDLSDIHYGNNNVSGNLDKLYHGTLMVGIIAAKRNNSIGIDGILNEAKIMPLCISANGDEFDKDIALAIRYAVDNGAKIINMSSGKQFSMNRQWVNDAIQYAAKKDVLFITSAGNSGLNLDDKEHNYYPNDINTDGSEISDNFMMIGASSYTLNKRLIYYKTNHGKNNVDLFAPGYKVYTTLPNNKYRYSRGTSAATPIVSGIAALIRSHYPDLSASQVKEILMKSGISYNIDVEIILEDDTKKMVPFSSLSKSGKIVNAYNALLLAEKISNAKN
ncbi:S8 family peptidase [Aquimarina mytili]|uniref:S8 family peptidase n=1 Tax=Aquimarina mytili TaxID=874423 RepID=A0A936ZX47_9FLAO|nr:S8 family peptidase [Aquimarina mytili]MBL0683573.1 S8 family peptidase [Aquimarina mytili]